MFKKITSILMVLIISLTTVPAFGAEKNIFQQTVAKETAKFIDSAKYVSAISSEDTYKQVAEIKAFDISTGSIKTMSLYEKVQYSGLTVYKFTKYNEYPAEFITYSALGFAVSAADVGIVGALVYAGLVTIARNIIHASATIPLSCMSYEYSYYGIDSDGLKSDTYNIGNKYVINDGDNPDFLNNVYYDGFVYGKIDAGTDYRLSEMIVNNLYGPDYDVY